MSEDTGSADPGASAEDLAAEARLYALLDAHGLAYAHHVHPPVYTVAESQALCGAIPGLHVKNLFLKEKKGGLWLVTCLEHRRVAIRALEKAIGARNCSFAKPELLWEALGVRPGAVTPFAAINDPGARVRVVLDAGLAEAPAVNAHPLHNRATTTISYADLVRFLALCGHEPRLVDLDALERA